MRIKVVSTVDGFRRAGIAHSRAGRVFEPGELTEAQIAALQAEPRLIVGVEADPEAGAGVEAPQDTESGDTREQRASGDAPAADAAPPPAAVPGEGPAPSPDAAKPSKKAAKAS